MWAVVQKEDFIFHQRIRSVCTTMLCVVFGFLYFSVLSGTGLSLCLAYALGFPTVVHLLLILIYKFCISGQKNWISKGLVPDTTTFSLLPETSAFFFPLQWLTCLICATNESKKEPVCSESTEELQTVCSVMGLVPCISLNDFLRACFKRGLFNS